MTREDFEQMRERVINRCLEVASVKGEDYTKGNTDVLSNFKEGGTDLGVVPMKTLGIFMKKHTDAIFNYIKREGAHESEPIEERIVDAINYLIFLQALIDDKKAGR